MIPDDQFQVLLPSNVSSKLHPENRGHHYTTELPMHMQLEGSWEVALVDIQYPNPSRNWQMPVDVAVAFYTNEKGRRVAIKDSLDKMVYNSMIKDNLIPFTGNHNGHPFLILNEDDTYRSSHEHSGLLADPRDTPPETTPDVLFYKEPKWLTLKRDFAYGRFKIEPQHMKSIDYVCQKINKALRELIGELKPGELPPQFIYNELDDRVDCTLGTTCVQMFCSDGYLPQILGFPVDPAYKTGPLELKIGSRAIRSPELDVIRSMYVYTDIVQYQTVGQTQTPLLAVLPVIGEPKQQNYWACQPPYYMPVQIRELNNINIRLATDTGDQFPVSANGKVVVRLHFRRKRIL